jgi:chlorite dismutase
MTSTTAQSPVTYSFFMLVKTTPAWLVLTPEQRFGFLGETIAPLLERNPAVSMRFFDSEAFHARYTDVVVWETDQPMAYQALVEELRETPFWDTYFDIVDIVPAIENAYARHYQVDPL